jgi:hypothetical protein
VISDLRLAEYDDRTETEVMADTYCQLEWLRYDLGRKPGWTAVTYRKLFGAWPEQWMKGLQPVEACMAVRRMVRRWDNTYKKEMRGKNGDAGGALSGGDTSSTSTGGLP